MAKPKSLTKIKAAQKSCIPYAVKLRNYRVCLSLPSGSTDKKSPVPDLYDHDEQMSDVSPSMASSPTETMATISPSTPIGPISRDEALAIAAANAAVIGLVHPSSYQKRSNTMNASSGNTDDKMMMHHPYKQHNRPHSIHTSNGVSPATGEAVTITMCPSKDAL